MKLITGILIGMVLICSIIAGPLTSTSASSQTDETNEPYSPDATSEFSKDDILATLKQAGAEIDDRDIAGYYQLLIAQYDLDDTSAVSDDLDPLPDINRIVRQATSLPLLEAGKNIQDKEIARFYHDFLEDAGWEFD